MRLDDWIDWVAEAARLIAYTLVVAALGALLGASVMVQYYDDHPAPAWRTTMDSLHVEVAGLREQVEGVCVDIQRER